MFRDRFSVIVMSGLVLALALSVTAIAKPRHEALRGSCGDINADGRVSIVDAMWIAQAVVGLRELPRHCRCDEEEDDQ